MTAPRRPSLALLTLNVNGLGDKAKRLTLFSSLLDGSWDVVVLQETHHSSSEQGLQWTREGAGKGRPWPGTCFWAEGTTASRGVAILFRDKPGLTNMVCHDLPAEQHAGRVLRVDFSWLEQPLTVLGVYAPSVASERRQFFTGCLLPILPQHSRIIMGGDFNCVSSDLDVTTNAQGRRRTGYAGGLQLIEETYGLMDAWREQHPGQRDITHVCASDSSGARLDRWLVATDILMLTSHIDILEGLPGDHLAVSIHLTAPLDSDSGPVPWLFPLQLLDDPLYDSELRGLVQHAIQHRLVNGAGLSHGQRWEHLKREIRDHATEFQRTTRLRESAMLKTLRTRARQARSAFAAEPTRQRCLLSWQETNQALQQHIHNKAQAAALRAGVLWQHYGEQSTFYFYHLQQQRKINTTITSITDPQGRAASLSTTDGRVRAGRVLADFFSSESTHGLFSVRPTCQEAQQTMLAAVDSRLTEEAARACEGTEAMTLAELTASLSTLKRGKQPGSDGLPYEFLQHFWDVLGPVLLAVFTEAFQDPDGQLTHSQKHGTVTLLYKGSGSRADPAAYRPITLQNSDAKLLAKTLTDRWGSHIASVVDTTQTAFIPGRWIGDNVLAHLEEVEYLEAAREPGCISFLDFSKAYDRLDRTWLLLCMERMGFGPSARRWVTLLHSQLTADVRYNGWHSPSFPVSTGLAQGSPLSPLLFVLAAQPLAAHLRQQAAAGVFRPLSRPDGSAAPPSHQHADDITLHLQTREDLQRAIECSIQPFCQASGSLLNAAKSRAMLLGGMDDFHGIDPATGMVFLERGQSVRHLGVRLSTDPQAAASETYTAILGAVRQVANHWISRQLTQIGRVHVAKQVLASKVTYHATFVPLPPATAQSLASTLSSFVSGRAGALRPGRLVHALPWEQGGMRLIQVADMVASLQAKVISRLLEPERLVWKDFARLHFTRRREWLALHGHVPGRSVDALGYGARIIFSSRRTQDLGISSLRFRSYVSSFRRLQPHRLVSPEMLTLDQVLVEPLFHNLQIREEGRPLLPTGSYQPVVALGLTAVGDLHAPPDGLDRDTVQRLRQALPDRWRTLMRTGRPSATWYQPEDRPDILVCRRQPSAEPSEGTVWTAFATEADGRLRPLPTCPDFRTADLLPRLVTDWDPSRPWRPGARSCAARRQPYLLGPPAVSTLDPSLWGLGKRPCHHLVVREVATRLTVLQAAQQDQLSQPTAAFVPPFWRRDARGLRAMEARWLDRLSSLGSAGASDTEPVPRRRSATGAFGVDYSVAAPWMSLSPSSRPHWSVRRRESEEGPDPRPPPPPLEADDTTDLAAPRPGVSPPWAAVWSRIHDLGLDRQHRFVAWQILHAVLPCGASRFYSAAARETAADLEILARDSNCPHCLPTAVPETLTHMLSECPTAAAVWRWVARLFAALSDADPPSLTVGLLMADDQTAWQPPGALQTVWTQLRLATLTAIRDGSSRRRRGQPASAISMAASVAHSMRTAIHRDWQRVMADSPGQLTAGICCSSWLRGRQPFMLEDDFRRTWARSSSWCTVRTVSSRPTLTVHLGVSRPVPFTDGEA